MKLFPSLSSVVEFIYFQSDFCCKIIVLLEMTFLMALVFIETAITSFDIFGIWKLVILQCNDINT